MDEGQFKFHGVTFGVDTLLPLTNIDFGDAELRTNDLAKPLTHGVALGRDLLGGFTITFEGLIKGGNPTYVGNHFRSLASEWRSMLDTPRDSDWLYFCRYGRQLKILGRPGRILSSGSTLEAEQGLGRWVAEFRASDPRVYHWDEDVTESMTLGSIAEVDAFSIINEHSGPDYIDPGIDLNRGEHTTVTNPGSASVPFTVTISGAIHKPTILVNGTYVTLDLNTDSDGAEIVYNSRTSMIYKNGDPQYGVLFGHSRLGGQVDPGSNYFFVCGERPSGAGPVTAEITFEPADMSI